MKIVSFLSTMLLFLAIFLPSGQISAQKPKTTKTTTSTKPTKTITPGQLKSGNARSVELTKSAVDSLRLLGKDEYEIAVLLRSKTSTKDLVAGMRKTPARTAHASGTANPAPEPAFSAADESDAAEMLCALCERGLRLPSFDELTAIQQVYEVPDLAAMLRVLDGCLLIDVDPLSRNQRPNPKSINGIAKLLGDWMSAGQGPQWKEQYGAIFDLYFQKGVRPEQFFYEFTHPTFEPSSLFNISRAERINQVLSAASAHSGKTDLHILRGVMENYPYTTTNSKAVRIRYFIQNIQPDYTQTAVFWAELMKLDNVAQPDQTGNPYFSSVPMNVATEALQGIFGATDTVAAIRQVYQ